MKVESISLHNILSYAGMESPVTFTDERLWLVCGENGAGKSALFDGLEYALYGRHRGGGDEARDAAHSQQPELLVKHGEAEASIEVVLQLGAGRYRVTRHIRVQDGNQGGDIYERHDDGREELIPTTGRQGAWDWLRNNGLPPYELFRSAIYLRQGHAAHFLRGSSTERVNRFAMLLDLSRYTELSRSAKSRRDAAVATRLRLAGAREELGDISDGALGRLKADLESLKAQLHAAETVLTRAKKVHQGAEHVQQLEERQRQQVQRGQELEALQADADVIRADYSRVQAWNKAAGQLVRYWDARERSEAARKKALEYEQAAEGFAVESDVAAARLAELEHERDRLIHVVESEAAPALKEAEERSSRLKLELDIAHARAAMHAAEEQLVSLSGATEALAECQARERDLHWLRTLAECRSKLGQAAAAVPELEEIAKASEAAAGDAEARLVRADAALETVQAAERTTKEALDVIERQLLSLAVRLSSHEELEGEERECPVCAQRLTEEAHAHLRFVRSSEVAQQQELKDRLAGLQDDLTRDRSLVAAALSEQTAATRAFHECDRARDVSTQRLQTAIEVYARERQAHEFARGEAEIHCVHYASVLDTVTTAWHTAEHKELTVELSAAERRAHAHINAENVLNMELVRLGTLRGQRAEGAEATGDSDDADAVTVVLGAATTEVQRAGKQLRLAQEAIETARTGYGQLSQSVTRLEEQQKFAAQQARDANARAQADDKAAYGIHGEMSDAWSAELDDRTVYEYSMADVEQRRASASRYDGLLESAGALLQVQAELRRIGAEIVRTDPACRIPVEDARRAEVTAAQEADTGRRAHDRATGDLMSLEERREKDRQYRRKIDEAAADAETFGILADLLAEGGAIQTSIVEEMQKEIVHEVNTVLEKLGDGLRVRLGESRRARSVQLKDLVYVDEHDPNGHARHYQFLSGGEQFRVALALALALHRRVGRVPGTVIVDEGFGVLDGNRRDALAHQLTDASQGILSLGLAETVIICSHNEDVQERFPHRWHVRKPGGTAIVEREDDEGDAD